MSYVFDGSTPIYLQLIQLFSREIATGERSSGEKVDPVRELAVRYGVNPNTMQRALAAMESEGLMYSERTRGRFVTEDAERVRAVRRELAGKVLQDFVVQMKELRFTLGEAVDQVEQNWEVDHESHQHAQQ